MARVSFEYTWVEEITPALICLWFLFVGFNDFIGISTVVTLDGSTRITNIAVEIRDDRLMEGLENFRIFLSTSSPGCLVSSEAILVSIEDNDGVGVGDDPHFSIVLPSGKLLCYTVQGEHGFSFNLISNKKMSMNARFVPDSRRSEVTWMGSIGIIVRDSMYKQANATALRFEAKENKIHIGDKVTLLAKNIETITFKNGKLTISEAPPTDEFKYPSIYIDLQDVEISFTMKFKNEHLDLFWHSIGGNIADSHGIIGKNLLLIFIASTFCSFSGPLPASSTNPDMISPSIHLQLFATPTQISIALQGRS